jgi:hypothetical protein
VAALNPRLIEDTIHLIETYQRSGEGSAFRRRFDMAIARDVNATYKNRPLKLYFEILASTNEEKFGDSYKDIRRLVKHDNEGIIKETLLKVSPNDLNNLADHLEQAKENINSTTYPKEEVDDINKIEADSKDRIQKRIAHAKRLDQTEYLAVTKKTPKEIEKEEEEAEAETGPGSSPEQKKSYSPATEEEKARLMAALNTPKKEVPKNILVGPRGEPLITIPQERLIEPEEITFEPRALEPTTPSLPQTPDLGFARRIIKTGKVTETAGAAEAGISFTTGRVAATGAARAGVIAAEGGARAVARLGAGAAARTGAGVLAKLGFSAATGIATGGVGLVIGLAITAVTTFGDQIKKLGKLVLQVTIAIFCVFILMFFGNWGEKMNSLLPPYSIGEAAGLPTATPTGAITPTPTGPITPTPEAAIASCPIPGGTITCGSLSTPRGGCAHCSAAYKSTSFYRDTCDRDINGRIIENRCLCDKYPATSTGLDIAGAGGTPIILPSINNHIVVWTHLSPEEGNSNQAIQKFTGIDQTTEQSYYLQFHHTKPGSGRSGQSGQVGANICSTTACGEEHVHVQIGNSGNSPGSTGWMDAAATMCQ